MASVSEYPVHVDISVLDSVDIYRSDSWWKAAIKYSIEGTDPVIAIYLWHNTEGNWTRKHKYTIKSEDAWLMDRELVEAYLPEVGAKAGQADSFPVSDYYRVANGETVVKTDDWWKAIVVTDRKGSYDTHEVIIYLWQRTEDGWRRRQKYAVKRPGDWADDRLAVEQLLDIDRDTSSFRDTMASAGSSESPILVMAKELGIQVDDGDLSALSDRLEAVHLTRSERD